MVADAKSNSAVGLDGSADRFTVVRPGESHPELPTPIPHTVLLSQGDRYKNLCRITQGILSENEKFSVEKAFHLMDAPVAMKSNLHNDAVCTRLGKALGSERLERQEAGLDAEVLCIRFPRTSRSAVSDNGRRISLALT